jgi:hypothetical protein
MKINFNKKQLELSELKNDSKFSKSKNSVIAYGPGLSKKDEAFAFSTEKEFLKWSAKLDVGPGIASKQKDIVKARKEKGKNDAYLKARQIEKVKRIEKDLKALARNSGLRYNSKELFLRATRDALKTEGQIFDPATLFMGVNFRGPFLPVGVPIHNLSYFGFDNNISSIRGLGYCVLFEYPWYSGRNLWLVGSLPFFYFENPDLGKVFDNMASSVWV